MDREIWEITKHDSSVDPGLYCPASGMETNPPSMSAKWVNNLSAIIECPTCDCPVTVFSTNG